MSQQTDDSKKPVNTFCGRTRREFLWEAGGKFTGLALAGLLAQDGFFSNSAAAKDGTAISETRSRRSRPASRPKPRA